tara:strand:- start:8784 stop:9152 length:369 start_codon:yes stop_codon:yes gene_type:complete
MHDIWVPNGAVHNVTAPLGLSVESARPIIHHTFTLRGRDRWGVVHQERIIVVQHPDEGQAELDQKIGEATETFQTKLRERYEKRPPTLEEKKEIGKVMDQIRIAAMRRRESTNNLIYYQKNF